MKKLAAIILGIIITSTAFSQAEEVSENGYRKYYVILIVKNGEVKNLFKEGKGITAKINDKTVTGTWYFKREPDVVAVVGRKGNVLGEVRLNEQKNVKLETDEPQQSGGGRVSFGVGFGPVGVSTGGGGGGPRYMSYNMEKHKAVFDKQTETREEKIRREYAEKKQMEQRKKAAAKVARKAKK